MQVHACDGQLTIEYERPRSGIRSQGVRPGTILFRGVYYEMAGNARKVNGKANVLKNGCGAAGYEVNGWWEGGSLKMAGSAPIRKNCCSVSYFRNDNLAFYGP